jgi:uncharacterized damage-inducible protein DinB
MPEFHLNLDARYSVRTQNAIAVMAAALDDQFHLLREDVAGLSPAQLEWQLNPGMNTVGMLLAHMAVAETYWMLIGVAEAQDMNLADDLVLETIGIRMDDDGMPMGQGATPPLTLKGKTLAEYLMMIERAREATHRVLLAWTDVDLDIKFKTPKNEFTRRWALYHISEHFSGHYGQILLLKHLMKDHGIT